MAAKKATNPFYVVLMVAGTAFALTACAYGVMTVKMLDPTKLGGDETSHFFVEFMDEHGVNIMLVELGLLAVCTVLAIGTDRFWSRETESSATESATKPSAQSSAAAKPSAAAPARSSEAEQPAAEDAVSRG